jgi:hypothetical protein
MTTWNQVATSLHSREATDEVPTHCYETEYLFRPRRTSTLLQGPEYLYRNLTTSTDAAASQNFWHPAAACPLLNLY